MMRFVVRSPRRGALTEMVLTRVKALDVKSYGWPCGHEPLR